MSLILQLFRSFFNSFFNDFLKIPLLYLDLSFLCASLKMFFVKWSLFYMHALPLYVTNLFIDLFFCRLFFLFLFSRFYPHVFSFSFFCILSVKTSIWNFCIVCHFTLLFDTFTALFVFACLSLLSVLFFFTTKKFPFLFLFLCVFEHSPFLLSFFNFCFSFVSLFCPYWICFFWWFSLIWFFFFVFFFWKKKPFTYSL